MTVSVLSLSARSADDIAVTFEVSDGIHVDKETFIVGTTTVADLRICAGECARELYDEVSRASEIYRGVKKGLNILGYGTCSKKMLVRKLVMKGFPKTIAREAAEELVKGGFLNPRVDAAREAERCVDKLWGRRRIAAELFKKGYEEADIKEAFYALEDKGIDFSSVCAKRLERMTDGIPTDPLERKKVIASLQRYGFSGSEIKEALVSASHDE